MKYYDKDGDLIDLSVVYGVYKTRDELLGFFERCTNYTSEESAKIVDEIIASVTPVQYDRKNAARMRKQIEGVVPSVVKPESHPKKKKRGTLAVAILLAICFVVAVSKCSAPSQNKTGDIQIVLEESQDVARTNDNAIYVAVLSSEDNLSYLTGKMAEIKDGADLLDAYNAAKQTATFHTMNRDAVKAVRNDANAAYADAASDYIVACWAVSDDVMKYIDKQEMKYLSEAQELLEGMEALTVDLLLKRTEYLQNQGFSDKEITEIIGK